jgi:polysaccharide export outer membrane protein
MVVIRRSRKGNHTADRLINGVCFVAILLLFTLSSPGYADTVRDERGYQLEPGDRIAVTVFGQTELSGDLVIDAGGNINLPFIEPLSVKGLTVLQAQKLIRDRLAEGFLREPSVSVRISELRPMYVLGDVRTPGVYPYRYGSTVQSAVAAAGGFGVTETAQGTAVSEFLLSDERVRQLTLQREGLLIRAARLQAQLDGKSSFTAPATAPTEGLDISPIIENEKNTFEAQAGIQQSQMALIRAQKPHLESEIQAHNQQIAAETKQLNVIKQESDRIDRLVKQGLATQNTGFQLKLNEGNQELNIWRLMAEVSRLQVQLGEFDVKIGELNATFKRQVTTELRDTRERLQDVDTVLPVARQIRAVKLQYVGGLIKTGIKRSITVTRVSDGTSTAIDADESTRLEPGDIVDVKKLLPNQSPNGSVASGRLSYHTTSRSYQVEPAGDPSTQPAGLAEQSQSTSKKATEVTAGVEPR